MAGWRLEIAVMPERYALCRLDPDTPPPTWALRGSLSTITRSPREVSIICLERDVPSKVRKIGGWRALRLEGPIDHVAESGVLVAVAEPLARAGISIFPVSTFGSGYLFVGAENLDRAVATLVAWGHRIRDGRAA